MNDLLRTPLCDLLGITYPILQAGMGQVSRADLVAAVSNAGGLGVIGGSGMSATELREEIRKVRDQTERPFGVDIILPMNVQTSDEMRDESTLPPVPAAPDFVLDLRNEYGIKDDDKPVPRTTNKLIRERVGVVLEERVPVFVSGLGDPAWMVPDAHAQGMKVLSVVGSPRAAKKVARGGVDAVIAQGYDGGGHTGRIGTLSLVPQVVDTVAPVPVVAAGGIADGRAIVAALVLGAVGVWLGTRFLATEEAFVHRNYKERLVAAAPEESVITTVYTGKTVHALKNRLTELWEKSGEKPLPMPLQGMRIGARTVYSGREQGIVDVGSVLSGQAIGLIRDVVSAGEVVRRLVAETQDILGQLTVGRLPIAH
ncbi:MAG: nitronate monooxygenase [Chloroflexi bacterium]|nr:nitronate monooxygenase [Chloroflexota bacterium]